MKIKARFSDMSVEVVEVDDNINIKDLKKKFIEINKISVTEQLKIIFMGRVLDDKLSLSNSGILDNSQIHCIINSLSEKEINEIKQKELENTEVPDEEINKILTNEEFRKNLKNRKYFNRFCNFISGHINDDMTNNQNDISAELEKYASQLSTMHGMGFTDDEQNIKVLKKANGSLSIAMEMLFSNDVILDDVSENDDVVMHTPEIEESIQQDSDDEEVIISDTN